jgi:hypothetical protein
MKYRSAYFPSGKNYKRLPIDVRDQEPNLHN